LSIGASICARSFADARDCGCEFGGPKNGERHDGCYTQPLLFHLARARWAAYVVTADGRAFFVGHGTSRRKARELVYNDKRWRRHQPKSN